MTPARWPGALLLLAAIALHVYTVVVEIGRRPTHDEVEFVHGAVRVARGDQLYVDFGEHHPPFTFVVLSKIVGPPAAARDAVVRGRILIALCGAFTLSMVALLVWRATQSVEAMAILPAAMMAGPAVWLRGFGDVRPEPLALAAWWGGAALVLLARRAVARGCGVGLLALALVIVPKWPLESAVIGVVFLVRAVREERQRLAGIIAAVISVAAAVGSIVLMTRFDRFVHFAIDLNLALRQWAQQSSVFAKNIPPFFQSSPLLHPLVVIPAAVVLAIAAWRSADRRIAMTMVALVPASLIEIRFVYPYPRLWEQYYVLWSVCAAAVLAMAVQALARMARAERALSTAFAAVVLVTAVLIAAPARVADSFWSHDADFRATIDGGTQWVNLAGKIGTHDASYYSFGFTDFIPAALYAAAHGARYLPPLAETDLPPCRLEKGLEPNLRLLTKPSPDLPVARACFERLEARGVLVSARLYNVFEVRPGK